METSPTGGHFYLDRAPRAKHRLRRTRRPDEAADAARLWQLCSERTAAFTAYVGGSGA
jgi:FAD/FMN-containing dehydrogenase